jgi:ferritin
MLSETKVLEIRKHMPKLTEDMTEAQRKAAMEKQSKKNISDMLDRLLEEKPEETYKFLESVILHEEGEELDGIDLMCAAMELVSDPKVVDFLSRLTRLVLPNTGV